MMNNATLLIDAWMKPKCSGYPRSMILRTDCIVAIVGFAKKTFCSIRLIPSTGHKAPEVKNMIAMTAKHETCRGKMKVQNETI